MKGLGPIVIGLFNIAIFVVIMLIVGVLVKYAWEKFIDALPANLEKLYLALVGLMAIAMLIGLLLGVPLHYQFVGDPEPFRLETRVAGASGHVDRAAAATHMQGVLTWQRS